LIAHCWGFKRIPDGFPRRKGARKYIRRREEGGREESERGVR
jgi:hypothetical protein